jgi:DNA-directed RNA polymerase subunit RPC12/RpoP
MTQYNYRCNRCKQLFATETRADATTCPLCLGQAIRKFSFNVSSGMQEHWNNAVGQYVSNRQEMDDALKRQSEEVSARTGVDHEYVRVDPADMRDPSAHGVSEDSLEATRKRQRDLAL